MMDDAGVPVIGSMFIRDGWLSVSVHVRGRSEDVFVSPDGLRYVRAGENERADLVYHRKSKRFAEPLHARLRLEEGSALAKRQRKDERLVARGEKQREQRAGFEPADSIDNQRRKARKVRRKR